MTTPSGPTTTFATLAREKIDLFRSMGAFGKPAYQNHVQLKAMLRAKRGDRFANYLSKPTYDQDSGELRWTSEVPGTARRWADLPEDEKGKLALDLEIVRSGLFGFVQELRTQGGNQPGGATAFATLLEQAMKVPAKGDFLYFVGDQPMIAFWGFEDQDGHSVDPGAIAPKYAAIDAASSIAGVATGATPVVAVAATSKWRWLWWLLAALLLLLLLLFGLRSCGGGAPIVPGADKQSTAPGPDGALPDVPQRPADGSTPTTPVLPGGSTSDGTSTTPGTTPSQDGSVDTTKVPDGQAPLPTDGKGDDANKPADDPKDAKKTDDPQKDVPKTDDPKDAAKKDADKDKDKKNQKDDPKVPQKSPPDLPPDPKALKIPKDGADAKKMDFLQGEWKAGEGLVNRDTKEPLDLTVKFGKDGQGVATLRKQDGSTCSGPVTGQMNGGKLNIQGSQNIPCSNGGQPYSPPKIECSPDSGGQSQCVGVNPDGSKYNLGMRHK